MSRWEEYHRVAGDDPNGVVVGAVEHVTSWKSALDIGAGNLRDCLFLLEQGFERIIAVDEDEISREYAIDGVELHIKPIQEFDIGTDQHGLVVCNNVFFHLSDGEIRDVFRRTLAGLCQKGIFACNVIGNKDNFFGERDKTGKFSIEDLAKLTEGFDVLAINEAYFSTRPLIFATRATMTHHWDLILRKP